MKPRWAILGLVLLLTQGQIFAQNAQNSDQDSSAHAAAPAPSQAATVAPDDYSGMYTFLQDGEFLQLTIESDGTVTGFISRFGNQPSDQGTFLNQFFKQAKLQGNKLEFTTQTVHGTWFEFKGVVGHGAKKKLGDEGYYQLRGRLTKHVMGANNKSTSRVSAVVFQSFPPDVDEDSPLN